MSVTGRGDLYKEEVSNMRIDRRWFVAMAILFLPLLVVGNAYGESRHRWDIPHLSLSNGVATVSAGGTASALAEDGSEITVTGFGTFTVGDDDVTGGGTWKTVAADGVTVTGMGNFLVTRLIRFVLAPGQLPSTFNDTIGNVTKTHAGLVYLRVDYDDGSKGILIISCAVPGAPPSMFEGITASKGFVDYWNHVGPTGTPATANAGRTLFHLLSE
jgi:hypothetical protein